MAITTFASAYGPYNVTRAVVARPPETNDFGTTTQAVVSFETTDMNEVVSIVGFTLFIGEDGHQFRSCYDGRRRTALKPKAREAYRRCLKDGYSPDVELIY